MKTSMNLAREFEKILEVYGRDILVVRQEKKLHCYNCYNEVTQESSRDCPVCLGLGWTYTAERHTARSEEASNDMQIVNFLKNGDIGDIMAGNRKYYFKPNMKAQENDLIVEVEWDKFGRPTYKGDGIWTVSSIDRNQFLVGNTPIYMIYYVNQTPVRSKIRGIRSTETNGIKQYSILMEG